VTRELTSLIEQATGAKIRNLSRLAGGSIAEVWRADLEDGRVCVAKLGQTGSSLPLEGWMLDYLKSHSRLPVPAVLHASENLLLLDYIESGDPLDARAQYHAAELLAELHGITAQQFGFERDTVIGGLLQPNSPSPSWIEFFRDRRLLYMARRAFDEGSFPGALLVRIENLAEKLDRFLTEPDAPSLIHGDMWGGNVLCWKGRIAGFIDPAIYYADPEIELAFSTLFSTFGNSFFARYRELRPIRSGFFEIRRDLYNLYPLLVHVRLFGSGYVAQVADTLQRFGF